MLTAMLWWLGLGFAIGVRYPTRAMEVCVWDSGAVRDAVLSAALFNPWTHARRPQVSV